MANRAGADFRSFALSTLVCGLLFSSAMAVSAEPADVALVRKDCTTGMFRMKPEQVSEACERFFKWPGATNRDKAVALLHLGWVHNNTMKKDKAIVYWNSAIAADSSYIEPFLALGILYALQEDLENSLRNYAGAEKLDPNDWRVYSGRTRAYLLGNRQLDALRESERAIALAPEQAEPHYVRAMTFQELEIYDQAVEQYGLAVRYWNDAGSNSPGNLQDGHPAVLLAAAHYLNGNPAAAFDALNAYMNSLPDQARFFLYFESRATYLEALGRVGEAAADLEQAALRAPPPFRAKYLSKRDALLLLARGPARSATDFEEIMAKGDLNTILRVQVFLRNAGMDFVGITGVYDDATRQGLQKCLSDMECGKKVGSRI